MIDSTKRLLINRASRRWASSLLLAIWTGFQPGAQAQDSGLSFLQIGADASALARGDAGVATDAGAFATYWNPAGLAENGGSEIAVSHHVWIADIRTYAASGRFRFGSGGIGIFVTATGSGDLEARERPGDPDGFFDAQFVNAGIAYGRSLGPVRAGITLKYLTERIFTHSANGYAFDFGLQVSTMKDGLRLGAVLQNLGKMEKLNAEATKLPRLMRVGLEIFPFRILTAGDGAALLSTSLLLEVSHNTVTETTHYHIGLSGEVLETITARIGYISHDELRDISAGLGLEISGMKFDYAVLPFEDGFGGPAHILTLAYMY